MKPHTLRVAIDGVDASGETMLADELAGKFKILGRAAIRAGIDGFHSTRAIRYRRGSEDAIGVTIEECLVDGDGR